MNLRVGSCPRPKAGHATEAVIDLCERGGWLMISRLLWPWANALQPIGGRLIVPRPLKGLPRTEGREDFVGHCHGAPDLRRSRWPASPPG